AGEHEDPRKEHDGHHVGRRHEDDDESGKTGGGEGERPRTLMKHRKALCPRAVRANPPRVVRVEGIGPIYADGRLRLADLVAAASSDEHMASVPGCPEWAVRDVVAHVTGVCADVIAGNVDGVATEPWTAAQVAARRQQSVDDILTEWSEVAPQVE